MSRGEAARRATEKYRNSEKGRARRKQWKKDNYAKYKAGQDAARWARPLAYMVAGAKRRAKRRGMEFSITEADVQVPQACPVLGIELKFNRGYPKANSPSLDRVDNSRGYVPGNVRVISHRANAIKTDASLGELLAVYEYLLDEVSSKLEAR